MVRSHVICSISHTLASMQRAFFKKKKKIGNLDNCLKCLMGTAPITTVIHFHFIVG